MTWARHVRPERFQARAHLWLRKPQLRSVHSSRLPDSMRPVTLFHHHRFRRLHFLRYRIRLPRHRLHYHRSCRS